MVSQLSKTLPIFNKNIGFNSSKAINGFSSDSIFSTQELTQFILMNFVCTKNPQDLPSHCKTTCYVISYYDKFIYAGITLNLRRRMVAHQYNFKNNGIDTSKLRYYYLCPHSNMLDYCNAEVLEAQLILSINPILNKNKNRASNILNALNTKIPHHFKIGKTYKDPSGKIEITILGANFGHCFCGIPNPIFYVYRGSYYSQRANVRKQDNVETILICYDEHGNHLRDEHGKLSCIQLTAKDEINC